MIAAAAYPAFCATCIRDGVPLEAVEIDGRTFSLCARCTAPVASPEEPTLPTARGPYRMAGRTLDVYLALRSGPADTRGIALAAEIDPDDARAMNGVSTAIRRLRRYGLVEADGAIEQGRNGVVYRLARAR